MKILKFDNIVFYLSRITAIILLGITSCIEPYDPPAIDQNVDILVVDGFMNGADSSATVRLTKAVPLASQADVAPELNASVQIEDELGNMYPLMEEGNGNYFLQKMNLNTSMKYRLSIITSNRKEYFSDFIELKTSPPIDSITWRRSPKADGLSIYVNSHDDSRTTNYYQWTYNETWEYTAAYFSTHKIKNRAVVEQDQNIYMCWNTKPSSEILIGSTVQLTEDVIRNFELIFIPSTSVKIYRKYSLDVQQRALSKEAYDFWLQLKKTTESLGGLFDPLPSQVIGNLKSKEGSQPVLGYFSGGIASKKRIFIGITDLPPNLLKMQRPNCQVDTIALEMIPNLPDMDIIGPYGYPFVEGYTNTSQNNCLDCRDAGGQPVRPEFWP